MTCLNFWFNILLLFLQQNSITAGTFIYNIRVNKSLVMKFCPMARRKRIDIKNTYKLKQSNNAHISVTIFSSRHNNLQTVCQIYLLL